MNLIEKAKINRADWDDDNVKLEVLRLKIAIEVDDSASTTNTGATDKKNNPMFQLKDLFKENI